MSAILIPYGRTDTHDFFRLSRLYAPYYQGWAHHPALAFLLEGDLTVRVQAIYTPNELSRLSNDTVVMQQWQGRYESHFFRFTVGQAREFLPGAAVASQTT
jgi:hypothetical protein